MTLNIRQTMIFAACKQVDAAHKPRTVEALATLLPADFALEQIDLDEMASVLPPVPPTVDDADFIEVTGELHASEQPDVIEPPAAVSEIDRVAVLGETAHPPAAKPKPSADVIEAATDRLVAANEALATARVAVVTCQRRENEMRGRLSRAISAFQSSFQPYTALDQSRDFIASEQEQRRKAANGEAAPAQHTVGRSVLDRQRAWMRGTGPDDGRGNAGRAVVEGRPVYPATRRGAFVGKPPSVR